MSRQPEFSYGGQAVIEGVMIRGQNHYSLAVRREDGTITHLQEPLNTYFTGKLRKIPLIGGFPSPVRNFDPWYQSIESISSIGHGRSNS
ncbi:MAG: hypothetical protein Ct9H300mP27_02880 [Chloroflexota bacterium]|nr:MAG: hypothetical protein Ct9H300mP27_02880 [Chloroflexota bacterium]